MRPAGSGDTRRRCLAPEQSIGKVMKPNLAGLPFAVLLLAFAFAGYFLLHGLRLAAEPMPVRRGVDNAAYIPAGTQAVMFGTRTCTWCAKTRDLFDRLGVAYVEHHIDESSDARALLRTIDASGSVPLILIGDTRILGFNETAIRAALRDGGFDPGEAGTGRLLEGSDLGPAASE